MQARRENSHLGTDRVFDAHHTDAGEVCKNLSLTVPVWLLTPEFPRSYADGPQAITGHGFNHFPHHLVPILGLEDPRLTCRVQNVGAPGRNPNKDGLIHYTTSDRWKQTPSYHSGEGYSVRPDATQKQNREDVGNERPARRWEKKSAYLRRMISEAPLLYMRKPEPSSFFSTVLMLLRDELKV